MQKSWGHVIGSSTIRKSNVKSPPAGSVLGTSTEARMTRLNCPPSTKQIKTKQTHQKIPALDCPLAALCTTTLQNAKKKHGKKQTHLIHIYP